MSRKEIFEKADKLTDMQPPPEDVFEQLDALAERLKDPQDKEDFGWFYESLAASSEPQLL